MSFFDFLKAKNQPSTVTAVVVAEPEVIDLKPIAPPNPYRFYTVEHYPYSGFYYIRYEKTNERGELRQGYLKKDHWTGVMTLERELRWGSQCSSEKEAWKLVDIAIEQWTKATMVEIKRG